MKRLFKPWLLALVSASLLHGIFFLEFKDAQWGVQTPNRNSSPQLNVTILPPGSTSSVVEQATTHEFSEPSAPTNTEKSTPAQTTPLAVAGEQSDSSTERYQEEVISEDIMADENTAEITSAEAQSAPKPLSPTETVQEQNAPPETVKTQTKQRMPINLEDISEPNDVITTNPNFKSKSLLDIGNAQAWQDKADTKGQPFSKTLRNQIQQSEREQTRYERGIVEPKHYDITEDADGTKYVNINGVCWKMPEPGAEEEWQVVLSGCSGQKRSFRFELNITTDLLTPEQLQMLPFGNQE